MSDAMLTAVETCHSFLLGELSTEEVLDRVTHAATRAVPRVGSASITLRIDDRWTTPVSTDARARALDEQQYRTDAGPCIDALRMAHPVLVESTLSSGNYDDVCRAAVELGVTSVLATPLLAADTSIGALNLYAVEGTFALDEALLAQRFATQVAYLLTNVQAYWDSRALSEHLAEALASRATIDQAKGIIMATMGVGPDEAFEHLRAQSQHENVKLRDLATELVRRAARHRS